MRETRNFLELAKYALSSIFLPPSLPPFLSPSPSFPFLFHLPPLPLLLPPLPLLLPPSPSPSSLPLPPSPPLPLPPGILSSPEESLFTYSEGTSFSTFYAPTFIPSFVTTFSTPQLEAQARTTCGDDQFCLFDVSATNSTEVGLATLAGGIEFQSISNISLPGTQKRVCLFVCLSVRLFICSFVCYCCYT